MSAYQKLAVMVPVNAVLMYLLMFAMIDSWPHFVSNINFVYMALLMVAPMVLVMMGLMHPMFQNRRRNVFLYALFALLLVGSF
jgi:hypothetical protein